MYRPFLKYSLLTSFCLILFSAVTSPAGAATLSVIPGEEDLGIGQEFDVVIEVGADGEFVNAVQSTVQFPINILEVVSVDRAGSAFNFWVEEPTFSNDDGTVSFIGGTAKGVTGDVLHVLTITFRATGAGQANVSLSESVVTASDGKGTNILSSAEGASITVGTEIVGPTTSTSTSVPVEVEAPQEIVRIAVTATNLPDKPDLRVPLYPDEKEWYSHIGEVIALWEIPDDVVQVAVTLDQASATEPDDIEEKLFNGKSLGILTEGIWYVHVQFKNNVGWGETAHYKISIDTTAPLPFQIQMSNLVSDNPQPGVRHETQDSLSGISHALLFVDGEEVVGSESATTVLPLQVPGIHSLLVRVFDQAGNSVEDSLEYEILPLPRPTIDFVTKSVSQGELLFVSGKTIADTFVDVFVFDKESQVAFTGAVSSDGVGGWEMIVEETFATGKYTVTASARDDRGAVSYQTDPQTFKIGAKTVLSIGFAELGWFEILLIVVLLIVSGTGFIAWYYVKEQKRREAYMIIAGRDIDKLSVILEKKVGELESWFGKPDTGLAPRARTEVEFLLKGMKSTVSKMKRYLGREVKKVK